MSWKLHILLAGLACLLLPGAGCRRGGGSDGDGDSDVDSDVDSDADDDFDTAACDSPFALGGECDPLGQHCCGGGERCTLVADGVSDGGLREACAEETGGGHQGMPCAELGDDACGAGAYCFAHPLISFCTRFCANGGDCPTDPPTTCVSVTGTSGAYNICTPAFNSCTTPDGTDDCPAGYACELELKLQTVPPSLFDLCVPEGTHDTNADCTDGAGCLAGRGCYPNPIDGTPTCLRYCLLGETCADGQECARIGLYLTGYDFGHYLLGVCPLPAEG
jgi:hypothetical protein